MPHVMKQFTPTRRGLMLLDYKSETIGFTDLKEQFGLKVIKGRWGRKNGAEGGELNLDLNNMEVLDFDGSFDLPNYIKEELKELGFSCPWDD